MWTATKIIFEIPFIKSAWFKWHIFLSLKQVLIRVDYCEQQWPRYLNSLQATQKLKIKFILNWFYLNLHICVSDMHTHAMLLCYEYKLREYMLPFFLIKIKSVSYVLCASTVIFISLAMKMELHFIFLFNMVYNI